MDSVTSDSSSLFNCVSKRYTLHSVSIENLFGLPCSCYLFIDSGCSLCHISEVSDVEKRELSSKNGDNFALLHFPFQSFMLPPSSKYKKHNATRMLGRHVVPHFSISTVFASDVGFISHTVTYGVVSSFKKPAQFSRVPVNVPFYFCQLVVCSAFSVKVPIPWKTA